MAKTKKTKSKKKKAKVKTKAKSSAKQRGLDNLIPFKPGQSGNPAGPPILRLHLKTRAFKFAQMPVNKLQKIQAEIKAGTSKLSLADIAAVRWVGDACSGKWQQMQELLNRDEGKVADKVVTTEVDLTMTPDEAAEVLGILDGRTKDD